MGRINWYIGHMQKSMQVIKSQIKNADLIIQICDARSVNRTTNSELISLAHNKPIINVAMKSDLAEQCSSNQCIYVNANKPSSIKNFVNELNKILAPRIKKMQAKGLIHPIFYLMILGLPNVGKSTLINRLKMKKITAVQNTPGITKSVHLFKLNDNLMVYDTPGIMYKRIDRDIDGYILGTIGCISERVLPIDEIVHFNCDFYFQHYEKSIRNYFAYFETYDYEQFVQFIAHKYHFYLKNNEINYQRLNQHLFKIFNAGKICPVNYDHLS